MSHVRNFLTILLTFFLLRLLDANDYISFAKEILSKEGRITSAFFVPDDPVKKILLGLINNEQRSISMAQFRLSDKDLAYALCQAHNRGVVVRVITDYSCLQERYEKISLLRQNGIKIHIYDISNSIMHHKIFLFGHNFYGKQILWTGSSNATYAGVARNKENVIVTDDQRIIEKYKQCFQDLWDKTKKSMTELCKQQKNYSLIKDIKNNGRNLLNIFRYIK